MSEVPTEASLREEQRPLWLRILCRAENSLVILVLALMVLLPLAEIVLRKFFQVGITGSALLVQHGTFMVAMIGGAIAAREARLLSLSTLTLFLKGKWKLIAQMIANGFAVAITTFLAAASYRFVMTLKPAGAELAYGIPVWAVQMLLPIGFSVIALRLVWHASDKWLGRLAVVLLAAALVGAGLQKGIPAEKLVWPGLIVLFVATACGAPIFTALGGAALILFWGVGLPATLAPLNHYELVVDPILPSIPLFTLTGYFLAEGGASKRLVRLFQALVGQFRGGPAIVTALVCAFFTSFTGASGVTILALGGLLMPVLLAARYSEKSALGLLTGAGSLGLLFPPCLPLILYAIIAQRTITHMELPPGMAMPEVTINQLFLGGIGPGLLLVGLTAWWGILQGPKEAAARTRFSWPEARRALWGAKWDLLLPVGALTLLLGGLATPVEAAAATALYAFIVETIIHRDLHWIRDVPRVMTQCGLLIGGVLLILGMAMGLTQFLIFEDVPTRIVEWIQGSIHSKWLFLLMLNLVLLLVGCLMDIFSALVVVVPLIVPIGLAFGIDPVHLGIIFLANMELGYLTPPVGMNLFLSSYRFGKPIIEVSKSVIPMLLVLLIGVLLITYIPALTLTLPRLLR